MIACLRSSRFVLPDGSAPIFVELRRHHDLDAKALGRHTKKFVVTKRFSVKPGNDMVLCKGFDDLPAARGYWLEEVSKLEVAGRRREDFLISGFHEED